MPDAAAVTEKAGLTAAGVEAYLSELSNWGRWGDDDRIGTLNLITDEVRLAGVSTIRTGRAISLSRPIDPLDPDPLDSGFALVQRFHDVERGDRSHRSPVAVRSRHRIRRHRCAWLQHPRGRSCPLFLGRQELQRLPDERHQLTAWGAIALY